MAADAVKKIKLLYDARSLKPETRHWGPGVVTSKILEHLPEYCEATGVANYFPDASDMGILTWPNVKFLNKALFEIGPLWAKDFDVYWGTNQYLPQYLNNKAGAITVHDLIQYDNPADERAAFYFRRRFQSSITRANKIISVSYATADRIIQLFPEFKNKIEVIHWGYESSQPSEDLVLKTKIKYNFPFGIMLGAHRPRKKLDLILESVSKVCEQYKGFKLVITGNIHPCYRKSVEKFRHLIVSTGVVSKMELYSIIKCSSMLLYPTENEGFGIPILEGMAMETPVLCSDIQVLREIGGNAAVYIDFKQFEWSKSIRKVLESKGLASDLKFKGIENLKRFSWNQAGQKYGEIFQFISSQP